MRKTRGRPYGQMMQVLRAYGQPTRKPASFEEFYDEKGRLKAMYETEAVYAWFQKRHAKGNLLIDPDGWYRRNGDEWKVPYGVRAALAAHLNLQQVVHKHPFFVTWVSPKTGKRLRKEFGSIANAMIFVAEQAQHVDPEASIVSKHGFYIPTPLMGKFPRHMGPQKKLHYWCPRCMQPRRFRRTGQVFEGSKKLWSSDREQYVWKNVKLAVLECVVCGITNRDGRFRASNQPVEKRRFKRGVRRAKKRR
jgi:hypothetical protein